MLALEAPVFPAYARADPLIQPERFEELEALEARVSQQLGSVLESSMRLEEWLAQFSLESYAEPMNALGS